MPLLVRAARFARPALRPTGHPWPWLAFAASRAAAAAHVSSSFACAGVAVSTKWLKGGVMGATGRPHLAVCFWGITHRLSAGQRVCSCGQGLQDWRAQQHFWCVQGAVRCVLLSHAHHLPGGPESSGCTHRWHRPALLQTQLTYTTAFALASYCAPVERGTGEGSPEPDPDLATLRGYAETPAALAQHRQHLHLLYS